MKIKNYKNEIIEIEVDQEIDATNLIALPALIDPHVHFRTPGHEHKEDWETGAIAAISGGVTTVMDMPNNNPAPICTTSLQNKKNIINNQLEKSGIPLKYYLHLGATADNINTYHEIEDQYSAIKVFMGSSTGDLLVDKKEDQEKIFATASKLNKVVMVHAEDDQIINEQTIAIENPVISDHSVIRHRIAAIKSCKQAIELAKKYNTKLYICHISTAEEVEIIKEAKNQGVRVFAEVTPHHLFLDETDYERLGTKAQMNPPLRTRSDRDALWQAINDGIIDTIGTDHAPHTIEEKNMPYGSAPSGVPGIETYLSLLLDAHNRKKISLQKIIELTRTNIEKIFDLPKNNDYVLVDLNAEKKIKDCEMKTKCGWSPFSGRRVKGIPIHTIINNKVYSNKINQVNKKNMRHLISLKEQSKEDILNILELAIKLKEKRNNGEITNYLKNQTLIMLFQKTSTRTRLSFEAGMTELGGHAIFLDSRTTQFSLTDYADEIQAVMRFGHLLMFRAQKADDVIKASSFDKIPVIDACSEKYHPAQALSDLLTMAEHSHGVENIKKIVWLGIENNVSNTLKIMCAKLGIKIYIVAPEINRPSVDEELNILSDNTDYVVKTLNLEEALRDADYIHTDTWMDMEFFENGKVKEEFLQAYESRKQKFKPFQLNAELVNRYAPNAKIMHCMPCHIGYEISRDAVDHQNSVIFDQAENRMHMQKAIIMWLLQKEDLINSESTKNVTEVEKDVSEIPKWWPNKKPIYDINQSYDYNFDNGPFFNEEKPKRDFPPKNEWIDFLGHKVASQLGVPAGPLLNSKWTTLAANLGFDIVTYKTIRSTNKECQPNPNMIYVNTKGDLTTDRLDEKLYQMENAPCDMSELAVTNSFGMPSKDEKYLLEDIAKANDNLNPGQVMIVSIVGTPNENVNFIKDFRKTASIAKEAGAKIIEANFSCPNVTTGEGSIYTNPETVYVIASELIKEIGNIPLIIKVGLFSDPNIMKQVFINAARAGVRAICGINTVGMEVLNINGETALGYGRIKSGVCGQPIQKSALEFVKKAREINDQEKLGLTIIGCGGITTPQHFNEFFNNGADIAMSATGMMWDPLLAMRYHNQ